MEGNDNIDFESGAGGIVSARGTATGLVLRVDGRVNDDSLREAVSDFLSDRKSFVWGHEVEIEWVGRTPAPTAVDEISSLLERDFNISVKSAGLAEPDAEESLMLGRPTSLSPLRVERETPRRTSSGLFGGLDAVSGRDANSSETSEGLRIDVGLLDEPNARVICSTLRSGQKIESEHSVLVIGDVNSGAEILAGGDIFVLGTLRGVVHAGAYEETGGGRVIFALNLQPTQLRIGTVISRGSGVDHPSRGPELARVQGKVILVEPYHARNVWQRGRVL